jgi:hypothetical protein
VHRLHRAILALAFFGLIAGASAADLPANQEAEIQYLLSFVESSGCTFIRNGSENSPEAAADHLRLKYNRGKRYFKTAEEFIDRLASESSWTGKKYTINCSEEIQESGVWLHKALIEHRDQQHSEQLPQ